ncbi:site-specific DNA-methyltransferase [Arthrobacter sp. Soil763]|uniref:site-specific DNA-methyltransferase n=1 Tax=Arthrobacter sp. Soil763 TaxID=1736402 RepID=UPI00070004DA|nr:DNA methyltransferase [Arthrobacter sp. Soil763]KRE78227.1 DNA methyltransferase [Arthrobacter sp. Soil763]
MSRLNDLLRRLNNSDPALAADLKREVDALADRRAFGLNFERHAPEAVELPGRKVLKNSKVRILPQRGTRRTPEHDRLWRVLSINRASETAAANLESLDGVEAQIASLSDLVVVAEFRDPIFPGLISTGKVERGGDKPFHTVINAENFHALQTLLFTHRGKVDCIYIDPPYNTGAKDWKYNNDYVEGDDLYRHSKWLAFMERRLLLAKELLNPDDSALIVTIDEKEYLRLGMLLEQTFPDARIQMITSVINPSGSSRTGEFSRSDEYIYVVFIGSASLVPSGEDMLRPSVEGRQVRWEGLARRGANGRRTARPNLFYPIFFNCADGTFHSVGQPLAPNADRQDVQSPVGAFVVFPIGSDGTEVTWGISADKFRAYVSAGYVKFGPWQPGSRRRAVYFLQSGTIGAVERGDIEILGADGDGTLILGTLNKPVRPMTTWTKQSHSAGDYGSTLLRYMLPDRRFPFPKSLYAVEDALRFFVKDKPNAVVLDFFAGSGTTTHAVMRLNRQDGGRRQCISVTNNEVSADEQKSLRTKGLRPGDPEWEQWGICNHITKPRIRAAVTGRTPEDQPIKSDYKFTDVFPMSDGFEENAEFFTLTYESPLRVSSNREFAKIAPLLWMRAGSRGRCIDDVTAGWDVAETYGVIADLNQTEGFLKEVTSNDGVSLVYIVTDEDRLFESVVRELPEHVEPVRLYEAYLRNFEIETGRNSL